MFYFFSQKKKRKKIGVQPREVTWSRPRCEYLTSKWSWKIQRKPPLYWSKIQNSEICLPFFRNLEEPRTEIAEEKDTKEVEMKRRREMEKSSSEIRSAIEELSMFIKLKPKDNLDAPRIHIPTKPFLHLCNLVLQVLG